MRTSLTDIRWHVISLVLVALVGITGCGGSGGGADDIAGPGVNEGGFGSAGGSDESDGTGSGGTGSDGSGGSGGAGSGGAPPPQGPWPVAISSGKVEPVTGKYCGGPYPTLAGEATVQFSGTGPQSKTVTATWTRPWNSADTVRVSFVDLVPGPGQQADQYIPPNPHEIKYGVRPCLKPDITVKVVAVQVLPQKCSTGVAQANAVAHVTLENELTDATGPVTAQFRWERADGYAGSWVTVTFQPGGPKTLTMPIVWTLPAHGSFVAKAVVHVPVQGAPAHKYGSNESNFATYCIS